MGNIWPGDAESGEMEARGEKEGWQYKRVIQRRGGGGKKLPVTREERHEEVLWHFVLSS